MTPWPSVTVCPSLAGQENGKLVGALAALLDGDDNVGGEELVVLLEDDIDGVMEELVALLVATLEVAALELDVATAELLKVELVDVPRSGRGLEMLLDELVEDIELELSVLMELVVIGRDMEPETLLDELVDSIELELVLVKVTLVLWAENTIAPVG